jgi:hypothetical protein
MEAQRLRRRTLLRELVTTTCILVAPGCQRLRTEFRDYRIPGSGVSSRRETSGSTIGHDFRKAPAGAAIPPTGLGVDLVQVEAGEADQPEAAHNRLRPKRDPKLAAALETRTAESQ